MTVTIKHRDGTELGVYHNGTVPRIGEPMIIEGAKHPEGLRHTGVVVNGHPMFRVIYIEHNLSNDSMRTTITVSSDT